MTKAEIARSAVELLKKEYPKAECTLEYSDAWQLLVCTRLAAQCTDKRVNMIAPALFERFKTVRDFADADINELMELIKSCGLYKTKANDLIKAARFVIDNYNSPVPDTMEKLIKIPGVGRKTANLILGDVFGKPAVVVDTHCFRITKRLGLHDHPGYEKAASVERELRELIDGSESNDFCHRLVMHGRAVCTARSEKCESCCMKGICRANAEKERNL